MRFLLWNIERSILPRSTPNLTRVRIVLKQDPHSYAYIWTVDPARKGKRLNKKELHELNMRVAKHIVTLQLTPPSTTVESTFYATL